MFTISSRNQVYLVTLGCPRNTVDSEVMLGILLQAGYEISLEPTQADYLIVNTCGFLEAAKQESLSVITELARSKKQGAKLVVTGCLVGRHVEQAKELIPQADFLLGSGDVESILKAVQSEDKGIITSKKSYLQAGEVPRAISTHHYAYLKIAEGCRKRCSYCSIPHIKGVLRSKAINQVVLEFKALLARGVKEIILIAQDLGDFGKDQGLGKEGLHLLLKELSQIKGDFWIRLLYLYPDEITDTLIDIIAADPRICPYLDMPIQHIEDRILKLMRRTTTAAQIYQTLENLRKKIPDIHIRTSLIAGFPSETEEEFKALLSFIQEAKLHHVGVFPYSKEEHTVAGAMSEQIEESIKQKRCALLMQAQEQVVANLYQEYLGKELLVMVDGVHPDSELLLIGHHRGQCPDIDGTVIINQGVEKVQQIGDVFKAQITQIAGHDLVASLTTPMRRSRLRYAHS